jgi:MFS family permease
MNRRLALLVFCQGLFMTNNVTFIAINGLVGLSLAPVAWMATLPVTGYVAGSALATGLVGRHQRQFGRQKTFLIGLVVAILSAGACAWAAMTQDFWLLNLATLAAVYYNANGALYRFAAVELVDESSKEKAIYWVLAGGGFGCICGAESGGGCARWAGPRAVCRGLCGADGRGCAGLAGDVADPLSGTAGARPEGTTRAAPG